jgi:hypothetical protein
MKRRWILFCLIMLLIAACGVGLWSLFVVEDSVVEEVRIERFDHVLDEYVSLGSGTALHRMNTEYPQQTKMLIEDVLAMGQVSDPDVERKLRYVFLDSTVQILLDEVHRQYGDVSDLERDFNLAFEELRKKDPSFRTPQIYAQISCLNQSIVVTDSLIGISLDKYLGSDFPLYQEFYSPEQRQQMNRDAIVRDAISAYLSIK